MTYRLAAHSTSDDPSGYRSKKEEEKWRLKDPIERFKVWLLNKGWLKEEDTEQYLKEVRSDILDALKTAEKVPVNPISDIVEDVYSEVPWHLKAQREALLEHIKRYPDKYPKTSGEVGK